MVRDLGSPLAQPPGLFPDTPRTGSGPLVIPLLPREFDDVVDLIGGPQVTGALGEAPAYFNLLSFLPPAEYGALLDAAGFGPDESPAAVTGTADPLLFDWRRAHQPVRCDAGQRAALAACLETAAISLSDVA